MSATLTTSPWIWLQLSPPPWLCKLPPSAEALFSRRSTAARGGSALPRPTGKAPSTRGLSVGRAGECSHWRRVPEWPAPRRPLNLGLHRAGDGVDRAPLHWGSSGSAGLPADCGSLASEKRTRRSSDDPVLPEYPGREPPSHRSGLQRPSGAVWLPPYSADLARADLPLQGMGAANKP